MNFTKLIKPPAPLQLADPIAQWGAASIQIDHQGERANVLLVATDAAGARIPGGATRLVTVQPAQYRAMFSSAAGAAVAAALVDLVLAAGLAANAAEIPPGTTVVDAKQ